MLTKFADSSVFLFLLCSGINRRPNNSGSRDHVSYLSVTDEIGEI